MTTSTPRSLFVLAREAIDVQDACNLSGVVQSFARVVSDLGKHVQGTEARNTHPIVVLFVSKLQSLSCGSGDVPGFEAAYSTVQALAAEGKRQGNVYQDHQRTHVKLLPSTLEECYELALTYAENKQDALLRFFAFDATGERFLTSFSVLDGVVREHRDVTIPEAHWG